jgi:hypothetical protein
LQTENNRCEKLALVLQPPRPANNAVTGQELVGQFTQFLGNEVAGAFFRNFLG